MKMSSIVLVIGILYSCASRTDSINSSVTCKYTNGMYDRVLIYTIPTLTDHTPNASYYIYREMHIRVHIMVIYAICMYQFPPIYPKSNTCNQKKKKKTTRKPPTLSLTYSMNPNKK